MTGRNMIVTIKIEKTRNALFTNNEVIVVRITVLEAG
jgi:hypothetical protein